MTMNVYRLTVITAALVMLAGCTLEPNYHRPASGIATAWPQGQAYQIDNNLHANADTTTPSADIGWREFFTDPQLQQLIAIALDNNRDLRVAALNIEKARAQYRIQRSDLFPAINGNGTELTQHYPSGVSNVGGQSGAGTGGTSRNYSVGIGFTSYELDLFGRIRSLDHAALQLYFSEFETRKSTQISLVAEVANDYLSLLADHARLKLARDTYNSQKASYDLTRHSYDFGVATALDLSQAEQAVDTAKAAITQFTRQGAQDRNALRLVLGTAIPKTLSIKAGLDHEHLLENLPAGLPSDLITRRPDVLAAEHTLIAANANIGAARAAFFPSISLTGNFGTASTQLNGLFANGSEAWSFSPKISLPIFAAGANVANLKLSHVEKNIFIAQYQKAIQVAFREVADALAARGTLDDQRDAETSLVKAAHTSYTLSNMRFRQGVDNYLSVLDSQRTLFTAQQNLISTRLSRLQNLVTLYKALGGGWEANTVKSAAGAHPADKTLPLRQQITESLEPDAKPPHNAHHDVDGSSVQSSFDSLAPDRNEPTLTGDITRTTFQNHTGDRKQ